MQRGEEGVEEEMELMWPRESLDVSAQLTV